MIGIQQRIRLIAKEDCFFDINSNEIKRVYFKKGKEVWGSDLDDLMILHYFIDGERYLSLFKKKDVMEKFEILDKGVLE